MGGWVGRRWPGPLMTPPPRPGGPYGMACLHFLSLLWQPPGLLGALASWAVTFPIPKAVKIRRVLTTAAAVANVPEGPGSWTPEWYPSVVCSASVELAFRGAPWRRGTDRALMPL